MSVAAVLPATGDPRGFVMAAVVAPALAQRLDAGDTRASTRNPLLERPPATTLVQILLYEGRADNAGQLPRRTAVTRGRG